MTSSETIAEAKKKLDEGDARGAFQALRSLIEFPALSPEDALDWMPRVLLFAQTMKELAGDDLGEKLNACVPGNDAKALYEAAEALIELDLPRIAASLLVRANMLEPHEEPIVTELVSALERSGFNGAARDLLRGDTNLLERSFVCRYLLGFNTVATGDLAEAERILGTLGTPSDETEAHMRSTLSGFVARGSAARRAGMRLDSDDLRGWFYVMNGSLLLHESPHGRDVMGGRYAFVQDAPTNIREAIAKLAALRDAGVVAVPRVVAVPSRSSEILAQATATVLGAPLVPFSGDDGDPGLFVAYDMDELDEAALRALMTHRPGQVLWVHASCWSQPFAYAPDVVTFLYQYNAAPWGERLVVDPKTQEATQAPPDDRATGIIAEEIVAAKLEEQQTKDVSVLVALAKADADAEHAAGFRRDHGRRRKLWSDSPVKSASF